LDRKLHLIFVPIADQIQSGTYLLYDGACGTGGMLTVGEETLRHLASQHGKQVSTHLFGQEINGETYAIAKADLLLKGEGSAFRHSWTTKSLADAIGRAA
jgi:type I restriction enzyme M protein